MLGSVGRQDRASREVGMSQQAVRHCRVVRQAGKKAVRAGQNRAGRQTSRLGQVFRQAGQSNQEGQSKHAGRLGRSEQEGRAEQDIRQAGLKAWQGRSSRQADRQGKAGRHTGSQGR
jgi:hypothetical protein